MIYYIIKRILVMVPTLTGVMLVTFTVAQFVPGGPVEKLVVEMEGVGATRGRCSPQTRCIEATVAWVLRGWKS